MSIDLRASESQTRRADALESALGPLKAFLTDERVVEIMLNADGVVWVDKLGEGLLRTAVRMAPLHAERMLRLVASEMRLELNAQHPSLSAKLPPPWGARLQAAIPPIIDAPVFALRKPARVVFSLGDYVDKRILLPAERDALVKAVHARDNILIGGGTGSGKTTFANALVKVIAEDTTDRVHIVEDTPELQCEAPNRVQILVQPGVHSWRDAIMAAMRFRPDRILVGEVRDGSALELLKAWNTGHPGGLATIHANDTRAMLDRVCQLIEEVVHPAPRALVAQTIQVCAHIQRDKTHPAGRRLSGLDRVLGLNPDGSWKLEPIASAFKPESPKRKELP
jgi:P-type conjugative transfer ATPase TrbB